MEWWEEQNGFFGNFYLNADTYRLDEQNEKEIKKRTRLEVVGVEKYLRNNPNLNILDCPCGYGRHSIELAKRGHYITGIDLNTKHLELAKKNAEGLWANGQ
ncbi:MAG: class I SAM-dependent methyltransferase [Balneola sp.]